MSAESGHPQKTELGLDELRRRTRGLSQRHRTMLLLVNGKRERREVLALAGQAGVGIEFFNELVAMGLVDPAPRTNAASEPGRSANAIAERVFAPSSEWPATSPAPEVSVGAVPDRASRREPTLLPPSPPAVAAEGPASRRAEQVSQGPSAPAPAVSASTGTPDIATEPQAAVSPPPKAAAVVHAATASGPPRPKRAAPPVLTLDDAVPPAATHAGVRNAAAADSPTAAKPAAPEPGGTNMRFGGALQRAKPATRRAPPVELRQEPRLTPAKEPARPARIKMLAPAGPLDDAAEQQLLAEVRSLLIGTLLVDGPVTSSLTALRVRKARSRYDLTALVWEIERTLVRARRPREAQSRLSKARDLLGLGNTVVDEETSPGPHTRPQR